MCRGAMQRLRAHRSLQQGAAPGPGAQVLQLHAAQLVHVGKDERDVVEHLEAVLVLLKHVEARGGLHERVPHRGRHRAAAREDALHHLRRALPVLAVAQQRAGARERGGLPDGAEEGLRVGACGHEVLVHLPGVGLPHVAVLGREVVRGVGEELPRLATRAGDALARDLGHRLLQARRKGGALARKRVAEHVPGARTAAAQRCAVTGWL